MSYETRLKPFHVLGRRLDMWFTGKSDQESQKEALFSDLMSECKLANPGARLSYPLRRRLEPFPREVRKEIASGVKDGCAPLFIACKRGHVEIVQYLITVCNVDLEQRGLYEVPDDRSVHLVTPLWCAAVSGKLPVIKCLVEHGADVNATSDTGSTPVRSACFMTHLDIVAYLLENGADVLRANHNGGTCLINSVQSVQLCLCLLQHGASVNSCDIQNKTALHYAIQEHRFETTKLLLEHGADPHIRSRYNDDALQTACIKGASQIFNYLITNISYPPEQLANAHELIGSTFLDEHNDTATAMSHWYIATQIRLSFGSPENVSLPKKPVVPQRAAFRNSVEFKTMEELSNVSLNVDAMRMQSLLICERLLGANHKDTLFRLMYRGASYADALRYQRCIDLWRRALEIRVEKDTCIPYTVLLKELDIKHVRDLEDLIIEAVYSDIIHGKLDQKNSQLEVDNAIGRDIQPDDIGTIVTTLQEWCDSCEAVLVCVESQIIRANAEKNRRLKHKETIEQEIVNIKKTLKTQSQDHDEAMATDSREAIAQVGDKGKKTLKSKGIRGSSKFWQK